MRMRSGSWPFASLLAAWLSAGATLPAAGQEAVRLEAHVDGEALVVSGAFAGGLVMTAHADGVEWLATFDGPVRVELAQGTLELASPWIAGVQTGYDTVLVRAARDVAFELTGRAGGFDLRLVPRGPADPAADVLGQRRLELLRAQWYAAQGAGNAELRTLAALVRQAPADARALAALGAAERRIGWRRRAADTFARALALDRADPDVRAWLAELRAERAPRVRVDVEHRDVASEWATTSQRTEGTRALSSSVLFGGRLELLRFDARRVRRPSGEITALSRTSRRGEAWVEFDTRGGSTWTASASAASGGPGAGVTFTRPQPTGRWTLQAEAGKPFWEFAEGLADGGTRSRVAVERRQRLGRRADAWLIAFASRYAVESGASASTAGVTGGVVVAVRQAAPFVAVSYGLDRETLRGATQRTDAAGHRFAPVPIVSREVHVPAVQVRQEIRKSLALDVHAGYAVDRLGGRGPVVEAHVRWSRGRVGGDVWVDRRLQTLATTTVVTRVGVSVAIRVGARS